MLMGSGWTFNPCQGSGVRGPEVSPGDPQKGREAKPEKSKINPRMSQMNDPNDPDERPERTTKMNDRTNKQNKTPNGSRLLKEMNDPNER